MAGSCAAKTADHGERCGFRRCFEGIVGRDIFFFDAVFSSPLGCVFATPGRTCEVKYKLVEPYYKRTGQISPSNISDTFGFRKST